MTVVIAYATAVYELFTIAATVFGAISATAPTVVTLVAIYCLVAAAVMPLCTPPTSVGRRPHAARCVISRSPPTRSAAPARGAVPACTRPNSIGEPAVAIPVPGASNVIAIPVVGDHEVDVRNPKLH